MDWTGCDLVEVIPGKVSGVPLIKGTRIPADAILSNFEAGSTLEDLIEDYPSASRDTIQGLIRYAESRRIKEVA